MHFLYYWFIIQQEKPFAHTKNTQDLSSHEIVWFTIFFLIYRLNVKFVILEACNVNFYLCLLILLKWTIFPMTTFKFKCQAQHIEIKIKRIKKVISRVYSKSSYLSCFKKPIHTRETFCTNLFNNLRNW
jgi:hypothetical protein